MVLSNNNYNLITIIHVWLQIHIVKYFVTFEQLYKVTLTANLNFAEKLLGTWKYFLHFGSLSGKREQNFKTKFSVDRKNAGRQQ